MRDHTICAAARPEAIPAKLLPGDIYVYHIMIQAAINPTCNAFRVDQTQQGAVGADPGA